MGMEHISRTEIFNGTGGCIHPQFIIRLDFFHIVADFQQRQTDIDAIAVKDTREAGRDDRAERDLSAALRAVRRAGQRRYLPEMRAFIPALDKKNSSRVDR